MGDPTPKDPLGNARTLRNILERLRVLEQARPLQTAFNDASAAQGAADSAQSTASGALGVAQGASYDASVAQQQAQAAQNAAASKTKTTWSTVVPDNTQNPGTTDGDTWYVTNGTGGNTTAQYRWNAASLAWTLTPIDGAVLRNVIADTVKAGAVDGQTITGATIRSAASGKRLEMLNTRLDVYSDATASAASIEGIIYSSSAYAALQLKANGPSGAGTCSIYTPVSTTLSGAWAGTAKVSASIPSGLATSDLVVRRVFAGQSSSTDTPKLPVLEADSDGSTDGTAAGTRFYGNRFSWVDPYGRTPRVIDIVKPAYAASNGVLPSSKVIVTAGDFQLLDGTSIVADTGWIAITPPAGITGSSMAYRVKSGVTYLRGTALRQAGSYPSGYTDIGSVPAGARIGTYTRLAAGSYNGNVFVLVINTNGTISVGSNGGLGDTAYLGGISWLADN